jgi:hypothetical protein
MLPNLQNEAETGNSKIMKMEVAKNEEVMSEEKTGENAADINTSASGSVVDGSEETPEENKRMKFLRAALSKVVQKCLASSSR